MLGLREKCENLISYCLSSRLGSEGEKATFEMTETILSILPLPVGVGLPSFIGMSVKFAA